MRTSNLLDSIYRVDLYTKVMQVCAHKSNYMQVFLYQSSKTQTATKISLINLDAYTIYFPLSLLSLSFIKQTNQLTPGMAIKES